MTARIQNATSQSDIATGVRHLIWAEAARHYDERQFGALVLMVAVTNFVNEVMRGIAAVQGREESRRFNRVASAA